MLFMLSFFAIYFIVYTRVQILSVMRRRVIGLSDLHHLRNLVEYIPQHRGMANALLEGDNSFKVKLNTLAQKITTEIKYISELTGKQDKWNSIKKVKTIEQQWHYIHQNLSSLKSSDSFECHTLLVKHLLFLIHDIGDSASLLTTQDLTYAKLAGVALRKLPLMAEMLGQARGMGTGVAARGQCNTNMHVKLTYLLNTARQVANEVCVDVESALESSKTLKQQANNKLQDNKESTERFLSSLEQNIINADKICLPSTDYYNAGTDAIQHTFALLDNITQVMQKNLQNSIKKMSKNLFLLKITMVSTIITLSYLYFS